jgi:lysozyme
MASRLAKNTILAGVLVSLVGGFEGLRTVAYLDPVGIPTVCFGETKGVKLGDRYTKEECKDMLKESLVEHERGMRKCLGRPDDIPDLTYGAFLSFTYNVGVGAFCKSTMVRKANAGDLVGACNELPRWTKAKGITLPGLVTRREEEKQMCLAGLKRKA